MFVTNQTLTRFWDKVIIKFDDFGNPLTNECMEWNAGHFTDAQIICLKEQFKIIMMIVKLKIELLLDLKIHILN